MDDLMGLRGKLRRVRTPSSTTTNVFQVHIKNQNRFDFSSAVGFALNRLVDKKK